MSGKPQFNIPAMDAAAADLRSRGYDVVSPAELDDPEIRAISLASSDGAIDTLITHGQTWGDFLSRDVKLLADDGIDALFVLPGWEHSRGARLETFVGAAICGLPVYCYVDGQRIGTFGLVKAWAGMMWDELRVAIIRRAIAFYRDQHGALEDAEGHHNGQ